MSDTTEHYLAVSGADRAKADAAELEIERLAGRIETMRRSRWALFYRGAMVRDQRRIDAMVALRAINLRMAALNTPEATTWHK